MFTACGAMAVQDQLQQLQQEAAASAAEQRSLMQAQLQLTHQAHSLEVHQLQQQLHQAKWRAWSAEADAAQLAAVLAGDPAGPRPVTDSGMAAGAEGPSTSPTAGLQQQQCLEDMTAASVGHLHASKLGITPAGAGQGSPGTVHDSSVYDLLAPGGATLGADVSGVDASSSALQSMDSSDALLPEVQELLSLYSRIQCTAA
jgi:hypothetical protein